MMNGTPKRVQFFPQQKRDNIAWRLVKSSIYSVFIWLLNVYNCFMFIIRKQCKNVRKHQPVRYDIIPLSPLTAQRLGVVRRKIMVLDLDETLIHSHHDGLLRPTVKPGIPPDFILRVTIDNQPIRFFVHLRPHVEFFLSVVSQWFDLVIFTASMEIYGTSVADKLDRGRGILQRRYFRQHCTQDYNGYTKDLCAVHTDLSSIFILDNSPAAYRNYTQNAIPIKSWFSDPTDTCLLNILPFLDALRLTSDVRSILGRNLHRTHQLNFAEMIVASHPDTDVQHIPYSSTLITCFGKEFHLYFLIRILRVSLAFPYLLFPPVISLR